jgi:hypothetical protein
MASTNTNTGIIGKTFGASNHIFTLHSEALTEQHNKFQYGVDPLGDLKKLKTADMIHTPENIVSYCKWSPVKNDGCVQASLYPRGAHGAVVTERSHMRKPFLEHSK